MKSAHPSVISGSEIMTRLNSMKVKLGLQKSLNQFEKYVIRGKIYKCYSRQKVVFFI